MLASALSALSDRLDSKFLTAYWLPAFVAVLGGFVVLTLVVGRDAMEAWILGLDSVAQTLFALVVLLLMTMVAFVLRAVTRPLMEIFAGAALPRPIAAWSTGGQMRMRSHLVRSAIPQADGDASTQQVAGWLNRLYPLDPEDVQPTLFGNILATAIEHPKLAYTMEGLVWWPRLAPLVPAYFQDMMGGAQAPMMALLNLAVVLSLLAISGAVVLVLVAGQWLTALAMLLVCFLLARLCYNAAVSQAAEVRSLVCVAFDLYRHEILRQMDLEIPSELGEERALWARLTKELLAIPASRLADNGTDVPQT